ncbi:MAG: hypothetical protein IIB95_13900, partial [Candidatus Marinimicrobia bacterium]|nr:hypothetical protein [Candidatus Neomarinimicrobiota bacterium]
SLIVIILGWFLLNSTGIYTWYFLGALGMFILGAIDDFFGLSWHHKLPIQIFLGALVVIQFFPFIETVIFFDKVLPLSKWFLMGIFLLWFIGISNSINLIDGLDGLAGGFMLLITFTASILGFISGNDGFMFINIIITASILAFLHYNQKPAKFFMGDSGSLFLGFHLAVLPLLFVTTKSGIVNSIDMTPFILLSTYLIADTLRVFVIRISNNKHPLEPDQLHLHYQIYNRGHSHNGTLLTIFILCGIGCLLAIFTNIVFLNTWYIMVIYLFFLGVCAFVPAVSKNFIDIIVNLNNRFRKNNIRSHPLISNLKISFLPYIIGLYFISLMFLYNNELSYLTSFPFILTVITIISFIVLQETIKQIRTHTAILISIGILQVFLMISGLDVNLSISNLNNKEFLFTWLRYGFLSIASIIVIANYILNSDIYVEMFWSVTDLLVVFLLLGMIGVQPLGIGFPTAFSFEIGLVYFANKLWLPQLSEALAKGRVPA